MVSLKKKIFVSFFVYIFSNAYYFDGKKTSDGIKIIKNFLCIPEEEVLEPKVPLNDLRVEYQAKHYEHHGFQHGGIRTILKN